MESDPFVLYERGEWHNAIITARQLNPGQKGNVALLTLMGLCSLHLGDMSAAMAHWQEALRIKPDHTPALGNLANVLQMTGRFQEADEVYQAALRLNPNDGGILGNRGKLMQEMGRFADAAGCYEKQLVLQPNLSEGWNSLGYSLEKQEKFQQSLGAYQQAVSLQPDNEQYLNNYGLALFKAGMLAEANTFLRQSVEKHPQSPLLIRSYSLLLLYIPDLSPASRHALRCQAVAGLTQPQERVVRPVSATPNRLAFISSDFRNHPVGKNILPLLEFLNRQRFEIYCYAERLGFDDMTRRFQTLASHWQWTNGLSDWQVAQKMMADGVDVAIYLAGHFDFNRLEIARYRPAPLQLSWHDAASSGLPEMDYFISDTTLHPVGCGEPFSEKVYHLPTFYQYGHMADAPDVAPPPCLQHGYITFGSFNNPKKINHGVLDTWSDLLLALPDSRLRLKYKNHYGEAILQQRVLNHFSQRGVDPHRILLEGGHESLHHHLAHYRGIDIGLDTFPFTGATTTYEALWMGVPVVTLAGDSFVSRMAASLLFHCGLAQWVANTPEEYLTILQRLAADGAALNHWRQILRQRLATSPLCRCADYAHSFEDGLLTMWRCR